ncbi:MAG: AMP-binding protein, partial [Acidobacteria bacterium]|nr:AMP-binding protein [Acidobacteriota bacterium]NIQ83816.1 AMP-binding protein [Acidobacteriota bacterium]
MGGFFHSFERAATQFAGRCAIEVQRVDAVDRIDYARLLAMSVSASTFLAAHGAQRGQRWAILSENSAEWCAAYLGMSRLGLI